MSEYDYGNARLHVMKSKLLTREELETLASIDNLQALTTALTKTIYQKAVETALTRATGLECIDEALTDNLIGTMGVIREFYKESAGKMVALILRAYDIYNIKAILHGLSNNVPGGEILAALLPIGELNMGIFRQLAKLNDPREAVDLLASMRFSFAWPLLKLRTETPGAETFEMELALDQWYYEEAHRALRSESGMIGPLPGALALEIDITNVLTALRFVQHQYQLVQLHSKPKAPEIASFLIRGGHVPHYLLIDASRMDTVTSAVDSLSGIFLERALRAGLKVYAHSKRLSDIERQIRHYRLSWMAGQIAHDPLGIGVVLGYVALKVNEVSNIRWIVRGIGLGLQTDAILDGLEMFP